MKAMTISMMASSVGASQCEIHGQLGVAFPYCQINSRRRSGSLRKKLMIQNSYQPGSHFNMSFRFRQRIHLWHLTMQELQKTLYSVPINKLLSNRHTSLDVLYRLDWQVPDLTVLCVLLVGFKGGNTEFLKPFEYLQRNGNILNSLN